MLPGVSQGIPPRVGAVQITSAETYLQPTSAIRPEQRPTPSRLEQRPDPPIINRNVDSNEEEPRITLAETYNSSFSSPEQSHEFIIEETVQSRIRTDGSNRLNPSPRASSSISDNVALSSSNAVYSRPEHTLSHPRPSSYFQRPQFSTLPTERVQPVASLRPKPLDTSTSNRISPVTVSTDQSQEIQPSNSFFVPVQANEQTPRTQFETTVSETHSDAVASSVQVFGHPESHQPRQGGRSEASYAAELQDHVSLGWAHGNMGNAYLRLQQKDKALHHLKEALELAVTYEITPQAIGRTYNNLGTAYQSMNDLDKAEEYYDLALSQAVYGNNAGGKAQVHGNFGNVLMLKKKYDRAIVHYTEAYNLSSDRATKTTALHNRGCASYEKGETNNATKKLFRPSKDPHTDSLSPSLSLNQIPVHFTGFKTASLTSENWKKLWNMLSRVELAPSVSSCLRGVASTRQTLCLLHSRSIRSARLSNH